MGPPRTRRLRCRSTLNEDRGFLPGDGAALLSRCAAVSTLNEDRGFLPGDGVAGDAGAVRVGRSTKTGDSSPVMGLRRTGVEKRHVVRSTKTGDSSPVMAVKPNDGDASIRRSTKTGDSSPVMAGWPGCTRCGAPPLNEDRGFLPGDGRGLDALGQLVGLRSTKTGDSSPVMASRRG